MDEAKRQRTIKWMARFSAPALVLATGALLWWHFSFLEILGTLALFFIVFILVLIWINPGRPKAKDFVEQLKDRVRSH